jgi:Tol biopolymer transport system component
LKRLPLVLGLTAMIAASIAVVPVGSTSTSVAARSSQGKIVFVTHKQGSHQQGFVRVINPDGSGERVVKQSRKHAFLYPTWSPGGTRIAYVAHSLRSGKTQTFTMRSDGSRAKALLSPSRNQLPPAWSPSGRQIAFTRPVVPEQPRGPDFHVWVMNSDGSRKRQVTQTPSVTDPANSENILDAGGERLSAWGPDGRIYFESGGPCYLKTGGGINVGAPEFQYPFCEQKRRTWVVNPDGTGQRPLYDDSASEGFRFSPNRQRIAFVGDSLIVSKPDFTDQRRLTTTVGGPFAWSPDGKKLVFVKKGGAKTQINIINANGTGERQLVKGTLPDWSHPR